MILQETQRQTFLAFCLSDAMMVPVGIDADSKALGRDGQLFHPQRNLQTRKKTYRRTVLDHFQALRLLAYSIFWTSPTSDEWWLWTPTAQVLSSPKGSVLKKRLRPNTIKTGRVSFRSLNFLWWSPCIRLHVPERLGFSHPILSCERPPTAGIAKSVLVQMLK